MFFHPFIEYDTDTRGIETMLKCFVYLQRDAPAKNEETEEARSHLEYHYTSSITSEPRER
jgi:predicted dithiol-disulfide oxidoreductase (DUF899 family)